MKKKIIRKALLYVINIILIIILLHSAYSLVSNKHLNNFMGYTVRLVVSGSMEPDIQVNSINFIRTCDIEDIDIGDVVCFKYKQDIVHRVIDKKTNDSGVVVLNTKGDANESPDSIEITDDMIVGKVVVTWNSIAPILDKFSIEPGKIDTIALTRSMLIYVFGIGLIVITLFYFLRKLVDFIKALIKSRDFDNCIETYINDIDELILYREIIADLVNTKVNNEPSSRFEYIGYRLAKAKQLNQCRELHYAIKRFKRGTRGSMFWYRLFKAFDTNDGNRRTRELHDIIENIEHYTELEDTNTEDFDTNTNNQ